MSETATTRQSGFLYTGPSSVDYPGLQELIAPRDRRRYRDAEVESRAGYEILIRQIASGAIWLVSARKDLVEEYNALKQPDKAYEFRSELAAAEAKSTNAPIGK